MGAVTTRQARRPTGAHPYRPHHPDHPRSSSIDRWITSGSRHRAGYASGTLSESHLPSGRFNPGPRLPRPAERHATFATRNWPVRRAPEPKRPELALKPRSHSGDWLHAHRHSCTAASTHHGARGSLGGRPSSSGIRFRTTGFGQIGRSNGSLTESQRGGGTSRSGAIRRDMRGSTSETCETWFTRVGRERHHIVRDATGSTSPARAYPGIPCNRERQTRLWLRESSGANRACFALAKRIEVEHAALSGVGAGLSAIQQEVPFPASSNG